MVARAVQRLVARNDAVEALSGRGEAAAGLRAGMAAFEAARGAPGPRIGVAQYLERVHRHHNNAFFARVGGVSNAEMNRLELELLAVLDFEVMLSHRVYELYREHLEKEARRDGGGGDMLAGASAAAAAKAGRMAAVSPSKLLERAAVNGAAQHDDWRSLGTAAAAEAANGRAAAQSSSSSRYSFDC
ncbi:hypothetical protein OsJ_16267 [Oryza sativa Japonica Group]|uniref:Uncharacterized protein n=1 Tax=Oryza sativa subsp. japonica TaxID=39947 RepID=B9FCN6_ORYSJ|nr:hypothetical protein OsJ_16267 [Oryza sativa Japonica Group]